MQLWATNKIVDVEIELKTKLPIKAANCLTANKREQTYNPAKKGTC